MEYTAYNRSYAIALLLRCSSAQKSVYVFSGIYLTDRETRVCAAKLLSGYQGVNDGIQVSIAYNHFMASLDEAGITGKLVMKEPGIPKPKGYEYITTWIQD
jgi:hypothetical protein